MVVHVNYLFYDNMDVNSDGIRLTCVQSGFCCIQAPCKYGEITEDKPHCVHLSEPTENGQRPCLIHHEIKEKEKDSPFPMMGSGCSSQLFNNLRERILRGKANE